MLCCFVKRGKVFCIFEQTGFKEKHFGFSGDKFVANWQL